MFSLFILLVERLGIIILLAYILMNIPYFKRIMANRSSWSTKVKLVVVFGIFAMCSNITGIEIRHNHIISSQIFLHIEKDASLANTRVLSISVAGLIGGPFVGIFVGLISGISRFMIGGKDVYTYIISSGVIGLLSGFYGYLSLRKSSYPTIKQGIIIGIVLEAVQMICIIVFASNTANAIELVKFIALPMMLVNSLGTAIFLSIILSTIELEERMKAIQTQDVLNLTNETLPYFRSGLTEKSAQQVAQIIKDTMKVSAVSITNKTDILAHVGAGSDHHTPKKKIITDLSKDVIKTGKMKHAHSRQEIGCSHPGCPLERAIVVPLESKDEVIGTLKFYFTEQRDLTIAERNLAEGLAKIFSSQIELGRVDIQSKLLKDAEIKSLHAQVNPHFFFNAINTISALIRVDAMKARELLLSLSHFFRSNLQGARSNTITVDSEIQQVKAYLNLEQARFPERFNVSFSIDPTCLEEKVPPFLIQILVENAIKHAFQNRKTDNDVLVLVEKNNEMLHIKVQDNGFGIDQAKIEAIGKTPVDSTSGTGSALENLNRRLISLFGTSSALHFKTGTNGTLFYCDIPLRKDETDEYIDHR